MFWTKCHAVRCTVDTFCSQVGSNVLIYICFVLMKDDTPLILKEKKKKQLCWVQLPRFALLDVAFQLILLQPSTRMAQYENSAHY